MALTTARMAYEHRDFLYVMGKTLKKKATHKVRRAKRKARVKVGRLTQRLQRFLGRDNKMHRSGGSPTPFAAAR